MAYGLDGRYPYGVIIYELGAIDCLFGTYTPTLSSVDIEKAIGHGTRGRADDDVGWRGSAKHHRISINILRLSFFSLHSLNSQLTFYLDCPVRLLSHLPSGKIMFSRQLLTLPLRRSFPAIYSPFRPLSPLRSVCSSANMSGVSKACCSYVSGAPS